MAKISGDDSMILREIIGVPEDTEVKFETLLKLAGHMLLSNVVITATEYKSLRPDSRKAFVKAAENLRIRSSVNTGLASKSAEAAAEVQRPLDNGFMAGQLGLVNSMNSYARTING